MDQNQYYNGDVCKVNIVCDNSASSVDVKSFKIKLKRKVFAQSKKRAPDNGIVNIKDSKYLYT